MRINTGSQSYEQIKETSNWENQLRINMFKVQGLYPTFLRAGKQFSGIILPAFDSSLDIHDTARPTSYEPYRSSSDVDPKTGYGRFTGWFTAVKGYSYYGVGKSTFVSPETAKMPDPIVELRKYIFNMQKRMGDNTYAHLLAPKDPKQAVTELPKVSNMALLNVWSGTTNERAKDQSVTNRVLVLKEQAFTKLLHDLNSLRPASVETPVDADWPHFMFGDITNPNLGAVQFSSMQYTPEGGGFSGPALNLGTVRYMNGRHEVTLSRTPVTQQMLAGRYDLGDADAVLHIPSYEEIVDLLLEEKLIPYELLQRVCSDQYNGTFPPNPAFTQKVARETTPQAHTQVSPGGNGGNVLGFNYKMHREEHQVASRPQTPYAPTPTPNVPPQRQFTDPTDHIPGLEPVNDNVPTFSSEPTPEAAPAATGTWTEEDEKALAELDAKITSNKAELTDFNTFKELTRKKAAAGL